jgi:tripartite-type tricarboxylate transporter receptor subunit TctC
MNRYCSRLLSGLIVPALTCAVALGTVTQAMAQDYPSRPIRMLVPLAAGSTGDILARTIGAELSKALGQQILIDNKAGAGGTIAMAELARATPDGYTLALASQGTLVFNLALYAQPGYDSLKDFAPIAMAGGVSNVMVLPPDSKAMSVLDVIKAAKAKTGQPMKFSSGGSGTSHHLSGVLFGQLAGIDLLHVPYKGAPNGIFAVMKNEVDIGFYNTPTVLTQIRGDKLKGLGVTSLERSSLLPDIPTLDESGVKGFEVNTWFGFIAPDGTPPDVIARLHSEIGKVLAKKAVRDNLAAQGLDISPQRPSSYLGDLIRDDMQKWPKIIAASGAKAD